MVKKFLDFLKLSFAKTPITKNVVDVELKNSVSLSSEPATDVVEKKKRGRKKKKSLHNNIWG
jgi:hypothetical protein